MNVDNKKLDASSSNTIVKDLEEAANVYVAGLRKRLAQSERATQLRREAEARAGLEYQERKNVVDGIDEEALKDAKVHLSHKYRRATSHLDTARGSMQRATDRLREAEGAQLECQRVLFETLLEIHKCSG